MSGRVGWEPGGVWVGSFGKGAAKRRFLSLGTLGRDTGPLVPFWQRSGPGSPQCEPARCRVGSVQATVVSSAHHRSRGEHSTPQWPAGSPLSEAGVRLRSACAWEREAAIHLRSTLGWAEPGVLNALRARRAWEAWARRRRISGGFLLHGCFTPPWLDLKASRARRARRVWTRRRPIANRRLLHGCFTASRRSP